MGGLPGPARVRPAADGAATPPRRLLVPVVAAAAVVAVLAAVAVAVALRPVSPGPTPARDTPPTPAPASTPAGASQSAADARRDGVHPMVAALPVLARLAGSDEVRTNEGNWAITEPDLSRLPLDENGCLPRVEGGPAYRVCTGYSEVLLVAPGGIVRAYPFPDVRPTWSTTTANAFYCGRPGDGGVPQNMVCRIDRRTLELTGRLYACGGPDCAPRDPADLATWPGRWSQGTDPFDEPFTGVDTSTGDLTVRDGAGRPVAVLDAVTLEER